jgi:hypothetical protein
MNERSRDQPLLKTVLPREVEQEEADEQGDHRRPPGVTSMANPAISRITPNIFLPMMMATRTAGGRLIQLRSGLLSWAK